jgi:flavin reductase (DIM6/NTAB) family NADH-FMN oxidoreductase RutF
MDPDQKKAALRMIPYGLYVITGKDTAGRLTAATINWVTQASFEPPLIVAGVKVDSNTHAVINSIGGETFSEGTTGGPVFDNVPAWIECNLVDTVERGDHSVFVGEVVNASVSMMPDGRLDEATLVLGDLGEKVFYGG